MLLTTLLITVFVVMALAVMIIALCRWLLGVRRHARSEERRCVCGYLLVGLEIPRCPECGRMIGFDKSPEELGVSEKEMRAEAERRRASRGSAKIP